MANVTLDADVEDIRGAEEGEGEAGATASTDEAEEEAEEGEEGEGEEELFAGYEEDPASQEAEEVRGLHITRFSDYCKQHLRHTGNHDKNGSALQRVAAAAGASACCSPVALPAVMPYAQSRTLPQRMVPCSCTLPLWRAPLHHSPVPAVTPAPAASLCP